MRWPRPRARSRAPELREAPPRPIPVAARVGRTGEARADQGGAADSGVRFGDTTIDNSQHVHIHQPSGTPAASFGYIDLIKDRFFVPLRDREEELAELTQFCISAEGPDYTWWQANAYAGKSALMAHLVLHPPPGARMVAFFVTARFAGQDGQDAYITNVVQQLAEVIRRPVPTIAPQTWPSTLSSMMNEAATCCQQRNERLILVVDGLDEDAGVNGPGGHSIAALLPQHPPSGMRVIVSSRTNPDVPYDVPPTHPLHSQSIVRVLTPSSYAAAARDQAEMELERLLSDHGAGHGPATISGRQAVGLLTAARGALTIADLAQLTGAVPHIVERLVARTTAARSLRRVRVRNVPGFAAVFGYELAHQVLAAAAEASLAAELPGMHDQLRAWAQAYQGDPAQDQSGWPPDTPDYLFGGYFSLLASRREVQAMTTLALDAARHERMRERTGTDLAGIRETTTSLAACLAVEYPDVAAIAKLAVHRDTLRMRNNGMPQHLLAAWVKLGYSDHALNLARACNDPSSQSHALAEVARALADTVEVARAKDVALEAERIAYTISRLKWRRHALVDTARVLVEVGLVDEAERAARAIPMPGARGFALAEVARALAKVGKMTQARERTEEAELIARTIDYLPSRCGMLVEVSRAFAAAGEHERAADLAHEAAWTIRTSDDPGADSMRVEVAKALAEAGLIGEAEQSTREIEDPGPRSRALAEVIRVLASTGETGRVETLVREVEGTISTLGDPRSRVWVLAEVVGVLVGVSEAGRIDELARETEQLARASEDPQAQGWVLADVSGILAKVGLISEAEQAARAIENQLARFRALVELARALTETNEIERARRAAEEALQAAYSVEDPASSAQMLAEVARVLAETGERARAEEAARDAERTIRDIEYPGSRADVRAQLARALAEAGLIREAERAARDIEDTGSRSWVLFEVARALAESGLKGETGLAQEAERIANTIEDPEIKARAMAEVARALAKAGLRGETGRAQDAERIANTIERLEPHAWASVLVLVARALAEAGEIERARATAENAEQIARAIDDLTSRAAVLAGVARARAEAGAVERAWATSEAEQMARAIADQSSKAGLSACTVTAEGESERAAEVAREVEPFMRALEDAVRRTDSLYPAVTLMAGMGMLSDAELMARAAENSTSRAWAMADIAQSLAAAGDIGRARAAAKEAEQAADTIDDPTARSPLVEVVKALAISGLFDDAEATAQALGWPQEQAQALAAISASAIRMSRRTIGRMPEELVGTAGIRDLQLRAERALAQALSLAHWTISLEAIVHQDPDLAVILADSWMRGAN